MVLDPVASLQEGELQSKREPGGHPAHLGDETGRRRSGSARGEHVIDDKDPLTGAYGVLVHFQAAGTVFQLVGLLVDRPREFSGLANRNEPRPEGQSDRSCQDEPASLDADYDVYGTFTKRPGHVLHQPGERLSVSQEGRYVLESDTSVREVGYVSNEAAVVVDLLWGCVHFSKLPAAEP